MILVITCCRAAVSMAHSMAQSRKQTGLYICWGHRSAHAWQPLAGTHLLQEIRKSFAVGAAEAQALEKAFNAFPGTMVDGAACEAKPCSAGR